MEHGFTWLSWLGIPEKTFFEVGAHRAEMHWHPIIYVAMVLIGLTIVAVTAARAHRRNAQFHVVPEPKVTVRSAADFFVGSMDGLVTSIMGPHNRQFVPFFGTIFIFILINNMMGLIPGMSSATTDISTNFGIAVVVFLMTHVLGFKANGVGYLKHFMGPMLALAPLMFVIELVSHVVRPVSLSIRLYGNMFGDHTVLSIFSGLVPLFVPVIFLTLGLMVCIIQAFVFTLLSMVYFSLAMAHEH